MQARSITHAEFSFAQDSPLEAKTYTIGSSTLQGAFFIREAGAGVSVSGTLVLSEWNSEHVAGSWYIEFSEGGHLAGLFDLPITVHE